jgi:hypothetical protein
VGYRGEGGRRGWDGIRVVEGRVLNFGGIVWGVARVAWCSGVEA